MTVLCPACDFGEGVGGLANRTSFNERLKQHFSNDDRRTETVSVPFVDIDDFKFVNDSIGHAAGDALLVSVAQRLAASVRPGDFVARLGGDESIRLFQTKLVRCHTRASSGPSRPSRRSRFVAEISCAAVVIAPAAAEAAR